MPGTPHNASRGESGGEGSHLPPAPTPHSPLVRAADAIDRLIDMFCQAILLIAGTILMGTLTANVIARYVLSTGGFDWAEEIPEQLFPWFIMAGVALAVQRLGHVAVEWINDKIGRAALRALLLVGHVLVLGTYLLLVSKALIVADIVSIELSPVLGLPKTYGYWSIAAGSTLVAISTFAATLRIWVLGPEGLARTSKPEATT